MRRDVIYYKQIKEKEKNVKIVKQKAPVYLDPFWGYVAPRVWTTVKIEVNHCIESYIYYQISLSSLSSNNIN